MPKHVFQEILDWSQDRPEWQRDALRRLFTSGSLSSDDVVQLVAICKAAHGLCDPVPVERLSTTHVPVATNTNLNVSLVSVLHNQGVNALAPDQKIAFGPQLTVIFGENAAGKSGYTRVLKLACRARATEDVLGNVLDGAAPVVPTATIVARTAAVDVPIEWTPKAPPSALLAAVTVFDARCAPVYLEQKTDVLFRPFGLDLFDQLAAVCGEVQKALESERKLLATLPFNPPPLPGGTPAKAFVDHLTALSSVDDLRKLASVSDADVERLAELKRTQQDLASSDPVALRKQLLARASRYEKLSRHIVSVATALGKEQSADIAEHLSRAAAARAAMNSVRSSSFGSGSLPGTGGPQWRAMWDRAADYSHIAYPMHEFPVTADAVCVLCQQPVQPEAGERLRKFADFVASRAQADLDAAEKVLAAAINTLAALSIESDETTVTLSELDADDATLRARIDAFLAGSAEAKAKAVSALSAGAAPAAVELREEVSSSVAQLAADLRARAAKLEDQSGGAAADINSEVAELEGRKLLRHNLVTIEAEIERRKKLAAYVAAIADTATGWITKKSTDLTKQLVSEAMRQTFRKELESIQFTHSDVDIVPAGGAKGVLRHHLVFSDAPGVAVARVLSEGESRALSLAAFLTELSIAPTASAVVFDDPVSSLDHRWRERIANRLVAEAKRRQVIVFTHDLLFWHRLRAAAEADAVELSLQYVRRQGSTAGVCRADVPWFAMTAKERIGFLKDRAQMLAKTRKVSGEDAYEREVRELYGYLREGWEIGLADVLLAGVVERYRPSIETQRARHLADIEQSDLDTLESEMTETSRWIRGHAAAAADGTPLPTPDEAQVRVDAFEQWVKAINKRRNG